MIAQPPLQPYIWGFVISCHTVRCILNHKLGKFELSLMLRAANSITSTAIPGRLISVILLHSLLGGFEASFNALFKFLVRTQPGAAQVALVHVAHFAHLSFMAAYCRSSTTLPSILPSDISLNTSVRFSIFSIRVRVFTIPRAAISRTSSTSRLLPTAEPLMVHS